MNKKELAAKMESYCPGMSKKAVYAMVGGMFEEIKTAVAGGDAVQIIGFGTFKSADRAARVARNPQDGSEMKIPAKTVPVFKPGAEFKAAVDAPKKGKKKKK